jgi:hypothetical protein
MIFDVSGRTAKFSNELSAWGHSVFPARAGGPGARRRSKNRAINPRFAAKTLNIECGGCRLLPCREPPLISGWLGDCVHLTILNVRHIYTHAEKSTYSAIASCKP